MLNWNGIVLFIIMTCVFVNFFYVSSMPFLLNLLTLVGGFDQILNFKLKKVFKWSVKEKLLWEWKKVLS